MSKYDFLFLNRFMEELSDKYDFDLRNTPIQIVKQRVSKEDWLLLHDAIKYGRDNRKVH